MQPGDTLVGIEVYTVIKVERDRDRVAVMLHSSGHVLAFDVRDLQWVDENLEEFFTIYKGAS